MQTTKKL